MTDNITGNATTIIKFAVMTIAPYLSLSQAMQDQLVAVLVAIVGFILAYADARYTNTIVTKSDDNERREDAA